MRMREHFATGAVTDRSCRHDPDRAAADRPSPRRPDGGSKASDGPKWAADQRRCRLMRITDYGPITSALGMGANWQVLEGLYRFNM